MLKDCPKFMIMITFNSTSHVQSFLNPNKKFGIIFHRLFLLNLFNKHATALKTIIIKFLQKLYRKCSTSIEKNKKQTNYYTPIQGSAS